jgi:hypothetical protein
MRDGQAAASERAAKKAAEEALKAEEVVEETPMPALDDATATVETKKPKRRKRK